MRPTKRSSEGATLVAHSTSVQGFSDMYRRLKRRMSTSGRSSSYYYTLYITIKSKKVATYF
jgi:hypothetical protein